MKILRLISLAISVLFIISSTTLVAKDNNSITIKKSVFKPGETIQVSFTTNPGLKANAWIGIIPSEVKHGKEEENDKYDIAYQYLSGKTKGKLKFKAPAKKGKYDLRMNDTDDKGKEIFSVSFTVK
ncbi:MAG: hypothetical protein WCT77_07415 [Bacteroidota bacterium]